MSTIVLKQDHAKFGKKGSRITAAFMEARDLVAAGIAERWNGGNKAPAEAPTTVSQEAFEKAGKRILELESQAKESQAELDAERKAAAKSAAEVERLTKEVATLTEQLNASRAAAGGKKK